MLADLILPNKNCSRKWEESRIISPLLEWDSNSWNHLSFNQIYDVFFSDSKFCVSEKKRAAYDVWDSWRCSTLSLVGTAVTIKVSWWAPGPSGTICRSQVEIWPSPAWQMNAAFEKHCVGSVTLNPIHWNSTYSFSLCKVFGLSLPVVMNSLGKVSCHERYSLTQQQHTSFLVQQPK